MFVFKARATATTVQTDRNPSGRFKIGAVHVMLVFVSGSELESAKSDALQHLHDRGWANGKLEDPVKQIPDTIPSGVDDEIASAISDALEGGTSSIVYLDPVATSVSN